MNIGGKIGFCNTSIIVYCDDLNLVSQSERHMKMLLKVCEDYANKWKIKFNAKKTTILQYGILPKIKSTFYINNERILIKKETKILGFHFRTDNYDDNERINKVFHDKTRKSFFMLSSFGLKEGCLNPFQQSFILKTYCLSRMNYGLELMDINVSNEKKINISTNNLIRYMIGLNKFCHISDIKKLLRIEDFRTTLTKFKFNFLTQLKRNTLCMNILRFVKDKSAHYTDIEKKSGRISTYWDQVVSLCNRLNIDSNKVDEFNVASWKEGLFDTKSRKVDSIHECLNNYEDERSRWKLKEITYTSFADLNNNLDIDIETYNLTNLF